MPNITPRSLTRTTEPGTVRSVQALQADARSCVEALIGLAVQRAQASDARYEVFERELVAQVFAFARILVALFFAVAEQRVRATLGTNVVRDGRVFRRAPAQSRQLMTWFGIVRYARTYLREVAPGPCRGFHPLDHELGLWPDRISPGVLAMSSRLSTRMSFAEARQTLGWFLPTAPSTEVIEGAVLGYGRHTSAWFEAMPAPAEDGAVLVIQVDSKCIPTATDEELRRRRGRRRRRPRAPSARHRGRQHRQAWTKKPRRAKGDKAKNGKMATMSLMYTLKPSADGCLLGPRNKRFYASFVSKRHVLEYVRREATRRGFPPGTTKVVQVLTDGDNDLARYIAELFPNAVHTIDLAHVLEKLWEAGTQLYREGSNELRDWFHRRKSALLGGHVQRVVRELRRRLHHLPTTGPGTKWRRTQLAEVLHYFTKRAGHMNYGELLRRDLEVGTGAIEGAIKNLIAKRMDHGGMRWIKERAEAVLHLRCIEANGDWDAFTHQVHEQQRQAALKSGRRIRWQQRAPEPFPVRLAA